MVPSQLRAKLGTRDANWIPSRRATRRPVIMVRYLSKSAPKSTRMSKGTMMRESVPWKNDPLKVNDIPGNSRENSPERGKENWKLFPDGSSGFPARARLLVLMFMLVPSNLAVDAKDAPGVDFQREVRPILARHCFACHGPDAQAREGDVRLDLANGFLDPQAEEQAERAETLLERITTDDVDLRMPPLTSGQPLSAEEVAVLRDWLAQGAHYSEHWSFLPPRVAPLPQVQQTDWPRNEIDYFILARIEDADLEPSPEASRNTLIRRLSLDLLGKLPTPDQVTQFCEDTRPDAYQRLVDRLLQSPHFGERWGRHWLDLARYADSDGYLGDALRANAYRYRDWVIAAINDDVPFDQFTIQQLAGDLLPDSTANELTATGFHRNAMKNTEAGADQAEDHVKRTVDRVSTTGTVWLGLTLACAECHAHKYDPISHEDFYRFYAFFNNLEDTEFAKAPVVATADTRRPTHVHLRGDFRNLGAPVQPDVLPALHPLRPRGPNPDRLDLAHWIVDPENPLTPRVIVNQVWKQLFSRGLVNTVDDFGTTGEPPSHPELLDHLAVSFQQHGWSRKALIRRIVNSATYRQASRQRPEIVRRDPYNQLLARQARVRLEAEVIRDIALMSAGLLVNTIGGPSILPPLNSPIAAVSRNQKWNESVGGERYRRGMYILFRRATPYPMLTTFDAPDTTVACAQRERSNSPLQSLTLLNDPVFFECAQQLGRRLSLLGQCSTEAWISQAYRISLARDPTPDELARAMAFVEQQHHSFADVADQQLTQLIGSPLPSLDRREQAVRVTFARVLMNLDEFITRE